MKLVTIIGARPQFIKAATVSRVIAGHADIQEIVVHTGQHYDTNMSDIFFDELSIPKPNYNLGIGGGSHGQMTGRQLEAIEQILNREKPDWVLVYGDTNSTLAGALAAVKLHIPVAHVEAGLRSFNRRMPEEINRVLTDHVADKLFAPTDTAIANLKNEGIFQERVHLVGDVMYDAALFYRDSAVMPSWFHALGGGAHDFVLATVHRAENTDEAMRMEGILKGLGGTTRPVILPLHPRTRMKLADYGFHIPSNVHLVEPVGYLEMVWLEMNAALIASDSGGVQKEAYFHGTPCITLRDETEWVELVSSGWNQLVGADPLRIASALNEFKQPRECPKFYGNGDAANKIVLSLMK